MTATIAWAVAAIFFGIVALHLSHAIGFARGASSGQKLGKVIGRAHRVTKAREFASSIGNN